MAHASGNRILVISPTPEQAHQFIHRVKSLSSTPRPNEPSTSLEHTPRGHHSVPWTISNRYYTADVHFETRVLKEVGSHHASGVPAVIYVWKKGDTYKEHIQHLNERLSDHDPEVSLAVRITFNAVGVQQTVTTMTTTTPIAKVVEEEDGLDEFMSSHGFEYIDGDKAGRIPTGDGGGVDDDNSSSDIPGLPRVIDALSTIMWPSLIQSDATRNRRSRARELLDWAREEEEEDGLRALVSSSDPDISGIGNSSGLGVGLGLGIGTQTGKKKKSRMQREMEELERWLEHEESTSKAQDAQAWITSSGTLDSNSTPTIIRTGEELGFEDDFTDFIGAPVDVVYSGQGSTTPQRLSPMHTGASYASLASAEGDDEDDSDLPSKEEIEETSRRIFGDSLLDVPTASSSSSISQRSPSKSSSHHHHHHHIPSELSSIPPSSKLTIPRADPLMPHTPDSPFSTFTRDDSFDDSYVGFDDGDEDFEDDEDFELGAFDLSRVLTALQGMKEEIAGMEDEGERRKAAARVALGLVYGLRKEEERDQAREGSGGPSPRTTAVGL
ncbi:hypothetical protein C8Q75DRAFT_250040 [Abortiporus biennis]|nr:hypothetical protein C8Q75DRAFT_250040 [Abortiporus biennis]